MVVDVERAASHLARAQRLWADGAVEASQGAASAARAIACRPVLPGVDGEWVERLRSRTANSHLDSLLLVARCRRVRGLVEEARSAAAEATVLAPLREDAWRLAMQIEADVGNTATALAVFAECRRLLADELGAEPSPATRELHSTILRGRTPGRRAAGVDGAHAVRRRQATGRSPYRPASAQRHDRREPFVGLRPFDRAEADLFFGRDSDVQHLVDLLAANRGVIVVGASGTGKSSVVRAGLLQALAAGAVPDADTWRVVCITPGRTPVSRLAEALANGSGDTERLAPQDPSHVLAALEDDRPTLVVVDQAEELFTLAHRNEADAFLSALLAPVGRSGSRVVPVLTLRADFYEHAAGQVNLARFLSRSTHVLAPLAGDGLEAAVTGPVRAAGATLEGGLLGRLLVDAAHQPGSLPLLQHVLSELWRTRVGTVLTARAYERLGGVGGALGRHAEETWARLDDHDRPVARRVVLSCVQPGDGTADAGRPTTTSDLEATGDTGRVARVVGHLVDARLLTSGDAGGGGQATVQLAHEALIGGWPRLGRWVDRQRGQLVLARRLTAATRLWTSTGRDRDSLLTGRRLEDALDLLREVETGALDLELGRDARALLTASIAAREATRKRRATRRRHERELRRRAERSLRVGAALTAAEASADRDPELALLLALEVGDDFRHEVPELRPRWLRVLHHALAAHHLVDRLADCAPLLTILPGDRLLTLDTAPGGSDHHLAVHDVGTGRRLRLVRAVELDGVPQVDATPDGQRLVVGDRHGRVTMLDTDSWDVVAVLDAPDGRVGSVAVSPDARLVAGLWFRSDRRQLLVHDSHTGTLVHEGAQVIARRSHEAFQEDRQVDFSPDGARLAVVTGPAHARLVLLDTTTWAPVAEHRMVPRIHKIAHSVDGERLGVAHDFGASVHDAGDLARLRGLHVAVKVPTMCWTTSGQQLVVVGHHLRTLARDEPEPRARPTLPDISRRLDRHALDRTATAVPNSSDVVLGQRSGRDLQRWDLAPAAGGEVARIVNDTNCGGAVAWSPSGDRLAFATTGGCVEVRTVEDWKTVGRFRVTDRQSHIGNEPIVENIEFTPDGRDVVTAGEMGTLMVWDTRRCLPRHTRELPGAWSIGDVSPSLDGDVVAVGAGGHLEVMDRSGGTCRIIDLPEDVAVEAVALSPDGRLLAATLWPTGEARDGAGGAQVWDWRAGLHVASLPVVAHNLSFHPDDGTLAVSSTGETIVWDPCVDEVHHRLVGHSGWVQDVTHSPDGDTLATAGWDGDLRLWDVASGELQHHFTGWGRLQRVRFHPSRPWIAVTELGIATHVLTLDPTELEDIARGRLGRALTTEERRRHLGSDQEPGDRP
nr:BTAD domain-containing putative transcriptional regulator [Salsipaludibacter albus]